MPAGAMPAASRHEVTSWSLAEADQRLSCRGRKIVPFYCRESGSGQCGRARAEPTLASFCINVSGKPTSRPATTGRGVCGYICCGSRRCLLGRFQFLLLLQEDHKLARRLRCGKCRAIEFSLFSLSFSCNLPAGLWLSPEPEPRRVSLPHGSSHNRSWAWTRFSQALLRLAAFAQATPADSWTSSLLEGNASAWPRQQGDKCRQSMDQRREGWTALSSVPTSTAVRSIRPFVACIFY